MAPARQNIPVWAGNTLRLSFVFRDSNSDPFDLTGSTLVFRAVSSIGSLRKDTDDISSGFEITDPVAGEVDLFLTVAETRAFPEGEIKYEIERWIGVDQISLLYGALNVTVWVNDDVDS